MLAATWTFTVSIPDVLAAIGFAVLCVVATIILVAAIFGFFYPSN